MDAPSSDHESWKHWFHCHGPRLLVCARQWTRTLADAEDVVQEAFVRFWRNQRSLGGEPLGLLLTSIRRSAFDLTRREGRRQVREQKAEEFRDGMDSFFEPLAEGDDRRVAIERALQRLPVEQREVLVLKIWGERTFEQIGATLALSPHTAASRYRYALKTLRRELSSVQCHE